MFESQIKKENADFAEVSLEANQMVTKRDFFAFLLNSKQIAVEYFKQLSIRPTQLNIMFSSILYCIAIYSSLERRENKNFSILLQSKIPGYTSLYQNSSWESFENLTSNYFGSKNVVTKLRLGNPKAPQNNTINSDSTDTLLPNNQRKVTEYQKSALYYPSDINFSKDRALVSLHSPWNKQAQKDFRAFFIDTFSINDNNSGKKELKVISSSIDKKYILTPWYKMDACVLPSDVLIATRDNSLDFGVKEKLTTDFHNFSDQNQKIIKKDDFGERINGMEYLIPCYNSKEQIFLENDSIPSKCNSSKFPEHRESLDSIVFPGKTVGFFTPKKYSNKYLAAFQHIMNQYFYVDGLLLLNLAETASQDFLFTNLSNNIFSSVLNVYPNKQHPENQTNSKSEKRQNLTNNFITNQEDNLNIIPSRKAELKIFDIPLGFSDNTLLQKGEEQLQQQNKTLVQHYKNEVFEEATQSNVTENNPKPSTSFEVMRYPKNGPIKNWQLNWYTAKNNKNLFENSFYQNKALEKGLTPLEIKNRSLSGINGTQVNRQIYLDAIQQDIKQLLNWDQVESENPFSVFVHPKSIKTSFTKSLLSHSESETLVEDKTGLSEPVQTRQNLPYVTKDTIYAKTLSTDRKLVFSKAKPWKESVSLWKRFTSVEGVTRNVGQKQDKKDVKIVSVRGLNYDYTKPGFKLLFCNSFRENNWSSMRYVSGYKFPDLNQSSVISLFKQFLVPRIFISGSFSFFPVALPSLSAPNNTAQEDCMLITGVSIQSSEDQNSYRQNKSIVQIPKAFAKQFVMTENLAFAKANKLSIGNASQLVNQVLLTPFRFNIPPALPSCYFKNLILSTNSFPFQQKQLKDTLFNHEFYREKSPLKQLFRGENSLLKNRLYQNKIFKVQKNAFATLNLIDLKPVKVNLPNFLLVNQESKAIENFKILYKGLTLSEFKQITKIFEKIGIDYQEYLKQPKDSPFALLISPSLEDDEAIKLEAERKTEQGEKKMTPFQLLQDIRETEKQLETAKDLRAFTTKNILASQLITGTSDFRDKSKIKLNKKNPNIVNELKHKEHTLSAFLKSSFFGEMSLTPKLLVAKDQKEIKEQLLDTNIAFQSKEIESKDRLPDLRLRAEKNIIDLLDSPKIEVQNAKGTQHRSFQADIYSSLKGSASDIAKFSSSSGQKRKITSNLFVAPSKQHVTLPQISGRDWKKIVEWQVKTYFLEEQKRLQSLRETNPEKQFKMKKLTVYLPWVTFRTSLNHAVEWPLTRLDFTEFVPEGLNYKKQDGSKRAFKEQLIAKVKPTTNFGKVHHPADYMIAAKNVTLSLNSNSINPVVNSDFSFFIKEPSAFSISEAFWFLREKPKPKQSFGKGVSAYSVQSQKREKLINKQYLFESVTSQSYLLIYRLFLLFLLKNVFQYIYRISLKQFLIKMAYSDFGLTVTSSEFREWLQNTSPKAIYKVHKPLQSIAGIEQNISTISHIIWHLRNVDVFTKINFGKALQIPSIFAKSAKTSYLQRTRQNIPAVLIVGPSSAEKTSLVQAIASEAKVAVVVQPLDALLSNTISPYEKLEEVFLLARKQAPCILYLDSIDRIGKSRKNVVSNYAGAEDSLFCLDADIAEGKHDFANLSHSLQTGVLGNKFDAATSNFDRLCFHIRAGHSRGGVYSDDAFSELSVLDQQDTTPNKDLTSTSPLAFYQEKTEFESLRINLLLRLLTEIDGISPLQGVIVMATSEQSTRLDPALLRPGRFQTIIKLSLPDKATRIQLLKIESQKLGSSLSIPWEYLATRTSQMSGADIVSAINHSAIRAILDNTLHTVQSLEHGLNCALGLPKSKNFVSNKVPSLALGYQSNTLVKQKQLRFAKKNLRNIDSWILSKSNDAFHISRLGFYQAGKVVVQNLLLEYPNEAFFTVESAPLNTQQKGTHIMLDVVEQEFKLVSPSASEVSNSLHAFGTTETIANSQHISTESKIMGDLEVKTFSATTKIQFQTRLVALYAGKAAELLQLTSTSSSTKTVPYIDPFLKTSVPCVGNSYFYEIERSVSESKNSSKVSRTFKSFKELPNVKHNPIPSFKDKLYVKNWQSNLALSDLLKASSVIHAMIDRWYLYSQKIFTFKSNQALTSLNFEQMQEQQDFVLFHKLTKQVYSERAKVGFWSNSKDQNSSNIQTDDFATNQQIRQERQKISWWNEKICQEVEMFERPYGKWYRLYLPKVEQRERNEEWIPPDLIFHDFSPLSNLSKDHFTYLKTLHDLYLFERDSAYYNVVINCFYKAFNLLSENRELVDFLADHFIRFKVLRSPEMNAICSLYLR